ncbi:G-type lectin S-receptor-like serine/threonine-protein kinase At4g27290 [Morus notabilis]|uniref:G-type lectin S-receptor-like serine/threonine-protein kinase At4g27290 n=1 Tax=Morus notabilis TaxID=981085 RepID=UPI000CED0EDC|nr:G-type lectin S-receptor-like serine/threonine-protein kinase At4g27290 [Morus notabilis]
MEKFSFLFHFALFLFLLCGVSFALDSINPSQSISDGRTLVSKEGIFEFGFFTPGNSTNHYLGIWYKKIPVQTVVWVANRCNPINDSSGMLTINSAGNLVLSNRNTSTVVWSTSLSTQPQKPILELLDSGNLVVRDEEDKNSETYLWQSFDYPCDTLLSGMKLGWDLKKGLNWQLSAWRNWDDPCPANFTYGVDLEAKLHTCPQIVIRKANAKFYRTGPWNGLTFSGAPELKPNQVFDYGFIFNDDEVYYTYKLKDNSVISILVLNQTSSLRYRLTWVDSEQKWNTYSSAPRDNCDFYGKCGANGNCVISGNPICQCLDGFRPKSQEKWNLTDWSDGCERINPLSCLEKDKDEFAKFTGLKLPDTTYFWVNKSMNLKECKAKCLSNCSCTAYTNSDVRGQGSGCAMWFGDLIDIRYFQSDGQELFVRVSRSELGKGLIFTQINGRADKARVVIVTVVAVLGGVSGMLLLGYFIFRRRRLLEETVSQNSDEAEDEVEDKDLELPLYNLSDMAAATKNFSDDNKIGEGGFGPVYKGMLKDGQEIAVKRLSFKSDQGANEFKTEVKLISKLQHRNLVRLLGCCIEGKEKMLVYEYLPNRSLDYFIFDQKHGKLLEWRKRFNIIVGIARGLLYLHQDSRLRIIHRDLKASNILLNGEMNPKISDFGLARIFGGDQMEDQTKRVIGTYGYIAPEYAVGGLFSTKSDVFSFGVLVLEIVSGRKSSSFHLKNHGGTLVGYAWNLLKEGSSFELVDGYLRATSHLNRKEVLRCIHIGLLCVQQSPADRPDMSSVILMLGSAAEMPQPEQPGYFMKMDSPSRYDHLPAMPESSSTNEITISQLEPR